MTIGSLYRPRLGDLASTLSSVVLKDSAASPTFCDDCQLPAAFRADVADRQLHRQVRVHQCLNCAKIIWGGD
jgi:hypothetical protein